MKIFICITMLIAIATSRDVTTSRTSTIEEGGATARATGDAERQGEAQSHCVKVNVDQQLDFRGNDQAHVRDVVTSRLTRFASVDVMIDTKDQPLAVYQLEFSATKDAVQIVGIEGSSHEALREPPYFDPQAIQQERVILAAFNTAGAEKLPRGKVRIATIHLQITGEAEPVYQIKPSVIATVDGKAIQATVTVENKRMPL